MKKEINEENLSPLEKYIFRIFEFILVPGFFMSTKGFFTGLITIAVLWIFYMVNTMIVDQLSENGVLIFFGVYLVLAIIIPILVVKKLSKYKKLSK